MAFTVVSYNVLATAYIKPEWYPFTPSALLQDERRIPAIVDYVVRLQADILCLQEVEEPMFAAIDQRLCALGYRGQLTRKSQGKPDGCATFVQERSFQLVYLKRVEYRDAHGDQPDSGHIAQILVLQDGQCFLGVANTHLKWDPPQAPPQRQYGYRQMRQLLSECAVQSAGCVGWLVCGDLNVTVDSEVVKALHAAGFTFSHVSCPDTATCNSNRRAKMIDYVFHNAALRAKPLPGAMVGDETPLPGADQPSDHVAVVAQCEWLR